MAEYRQVQCAFWQDAFILDLTPEEKYFYLYLMTNPKTTQCGVYELPMRVMEMETGYNRETIQKLLARFTEYGKIQYDKTTSEVMLVNWLRHNWINSEKVIKRIQKDTVSVKNQEFKAAINTILIGYGYGIDTMPEEEEGEEEREDNNKTPLATADAVTADKPSLPACPHAEILDLYEQIIPERPRAPRPWDGANAQTLRARWVWGLTTPHEKTGKPRYTDRESGLAWWAKFFQHIRRSNFLLTECKGVCLPWIVKKANFEKIYTGVYHDEAQP